MRKKLHHDSVLKGFTILELMVAVTIASILMIALISILSKSMDVSKRTNAGMLSKSSAQAALDVLVTDIDSMVVMHNATESFRYTNLPVSNAVSLTNSTIYLLTTSSQDSYSTNNSGTPGAPRLVQYIIQYTTNYASATSSTFGLYRNVMDPTNTFCNVIGSSNQLDACWAGSVAGSNSPGASLGTTTTNTSMLLVPNAVAMNVTLYTNYGAGVWTNAPGTNPGVGVGSGGTNNWISSTNFPIGVVVEISVTVLDEPALSRFGSGNGSGNNSATYLINQSGRTLIRRVSLPSPP